MTRHARLGMMRRCGPALPNTGTGWTRRCFSRCASPAGAPARVSPSAHRLPSASCSRLLPSSPTGAAQLSSAPQPRPRPESKPTSAAPSDPGASTGLVADLSDLNPPATTRPPPLTLPVRTPDTSTFSHLYSTGKAYLTFYKTGLRQIWTNSQLVRSLPASPAPSAPPEPRSLVLLRRRSSHDVRRLPLFALLLLVCGEFTPLVVLLLPRLVPYTCRIPRQTRKLRLAAQERAAVARQEARWARESAHWGGGGRGAAGPVAAEKADKVEAPVLARMLGVVGPAWDRIGWVPGPLARSRVRARWEFLVRDDETLRAHEDGVAALEDVEVELACADRGIDTLDRDGRESRAALRRWLQLTGGKDVGEEESIRRMEWLVAHGEDEWPEKWLPESSG